MKDKGSHFMFWQKTYEETIELLHEAKRYFSEHGKNDRIQLTGQARLAYTLVMSNITVKLTSSLSWLMVMRALEEGEIERGDISDEKLLLNKLDTHVTNDYQFYALLPQPVVELAERSYQIYNRVARLEELAWSNNVQADVSDICEKVIAKSGNILQFKAVSEGESPISAEC